MTHRATPPGTASPEAADPVDAGPSSVKTLTALLERSQTRFHELVDGSLQGILVHRDGRPLFANDAFAGIYGYASKADILDLDSVRPFLPRDNPASPSPASPLEFETRRRDGSPAWVLSQSREIDWDGAPATQITQIDMTGRWRAERELVEAKEMADRANAAKSRFLAAASHDLRQPAMALALFAATLEATCRDPDLVPLVRKTRAATDELGALLSALLDISKLDAGMIEPTLADVPARTLLRTVDLEFAPLARQARLRLRVVPSDAYLHTDAVLLGTILRNLVGNALRYTRQGGVVVGCRRVGRNIVRFEVWDSGFGIAPEHHELVFQEFTQLHNRGRNRALGLGLGLAVVSRLAGLLDHRIGLRSEPGRGSVFWIEVPRGTRPTAVARPPAADFPQAPARALVAVVDDDAIVRDSLGTLLECWGQRVVKGGSDMELLEALADLGEIPDLVIADFRLDTGRDGIDLIAFLRRELDRAFPALLLTGDTAPDRLREADASGLPLMHKPINADALKRMVDGLLSPRL